MPISPPLRQGGKSTPVVAAVRVYADLPDTTLILDVPPGELTTAYVDQARVAGGGRIRIHALGTDGGTLDRVRVR